MSGRRADASLYWIKDPEVEEQLEFNLQESLSRAKSNLLFKGNPTHIVITCTEDIQMLNYVIAKKIPIHRVEFVLICALTQLLDFESFVIDDTDI